MELQYDPDFGHSAVEKYNSQHKMTPPDLYQRHGMDSEGGNTAFRLKSFIKENLREGTDIYACASSSDESSNEMDYYHQSQQSSEDHAMIQDFPNSVTPEPQPLTRSNVTLHDGIWKKDDDDLGDVAQEVDEGPVSLSPPLKALHRLRPQEIKRNGASIIDTLSDAESDQSYSSQDTMILKNTGAASWGQSAYLQMFEKGQPSRTTDTQLHCKHSTFQGPHATHKGSVEPQRPVPKRGISPTRRVRFADEVSHQETQEQEVGASAAISTISQPNPVTHRNVNVDYSRMLGKGDEDFDDGYESTDNASSTSSSSAGTGVQMVPGVDVVPEECEDEVDNETGLSGKVKTEYVYVDCTKVPSFRQMNMELRKKARSKGFLNLKNDSIESRLKKLFVSDSFDEEPQVDQGYKTNSNSECIYQGQNNDETISRHGASINSDIRNPQVENQNSYPDQTFGDLYTPYEERDRSALHYNPGPENIYSDNNFYHGKQQTMQENADYEGFYPRDQTNPNYGNFGTEIGPCETYRQSFIPEQPKRPAPVLVDRGPSIRPYGSFNNLQDSPHSSPAHSRYGSQPNLQYSNLQNYDYHSNIHRYGSEPLVNEHERKIPNWRPISDLYDNNNQNWSDHSTAYVNSQQQQQQRQQLYGIHGQYALSQSTSHLEKCSIKNSDLDVNRYSNCGDYIQTGQYPFQRSNSQSMIYVGGYPYMGYTEPPIRQTVSDEHINTSGSIGSNDSGIEPSVGCSSGRRAQPYHLQGRRAPVNYTLDDTSRDPMGLVDKVRRRRESSPTRGNSDMSTCGGQSSGRLSMKTPILSPPIDFVDKDFFRLQKQSKSMRQMRSQPMKAFPLRTLEEPEPTDDFKATARKMLDSQHLKMKDDYSKYIQLYSNFQKSRSETSDDSESDATSRRSSLPDELAYFPLEAERQSYFEMKHSLMAETQSGCSSPSHSTRSVPTSPSHSGVKYMKSADIFRTFQEQGPSPRPNSPRSNASTPTPREGDDRWSYGSASLNSTLNSTFDNESNRSCNSLPLKSNASVLSSSQDIYLTKEGGNSGASRNSGRLSAKNSEIFDLYTSKKIQRHSSLMDTRVNDFNKTF